MLKFDCCVAGWLLSHSDVCGVGGADSHELMSMRHGNCIDTGLMLFLNDINNIGN